MNNLNYRKTIVIKNPYLILNHQGKQLPPFELIKEQHILGRNSQVADLLVPFDWDYVSGLQATIQRQENKYYIYDGDKINPSTNKLFINNTTITPRQGYCLENNDEIKIGQNLKDTVIITFHDPNTNQYSISNIKTKSVSILNKQVVLGRDENADLQLNSPLVSRKHAIINKNSHGDYILYDFSTNGVFVDGVKVRDKIRLKSNSIIKITPYTLVLQRDHLVVMDRGENIRLEAENISIIVKDKNKKSITLLNEINLPIEPGQFVALVGGSGAGKSTLMRTLLGIESTTKGNVYLNGEKLRENFNIYRNSIGYVPQIDIVHKNLKVEEVLRYTAQLRLPPDSNFDKIVEQTLKQIEMSNRRDVFVKNLSGGQLKRVSIGVELLAEPKLFFLDEPTSGLDAGLDKKMMLLLKRLANEGRTIILVTHAITNISLCDRIVFLGTGGYLCYFGNYQGIYPFFQLEQNENLADVYLKLQDLSVVKQIAENFKKSGYYKIYVEQKLSTIKEETKKRKENIKNPKFSLIPQLIILTKRYFKLVIRDKINLLISLLTAPIGIIFINLAIKEKEPFILGIKDDPTLAPLALKVLFVFTCATIWVGLATSLQEIIKENAIYLRERLVNLNLLAYLSSKKIVLGVLAVTQSILMNIVVLISFSPPETTILPWILGINITSLLTIFSSISLGLMVSSIVKNTTQANTALPLILLPQIIFSGVLFNIEGIGKLISWLVISRWSIGAYGTLIDVNSLIPKPTILPDGTEIVRPLEPSTVYEATFSNLYHNWGMLIGYSFFYLMIAFYLQKRKDIL